MNTCSGVLYIWEVAADSHELMILQRIMWPSIAHANKQLDPRADIPPPQSATLGLQVKGSSKETAVNSVVM